MSWRWFFGFSLVLVFALAGPMADSAKAAGLLAREGSGNVNIFDPRDIPLGIWTLVVFAVLLLVLKKWAWKPMLDGLHAREQSIQGAIEQAHKARVEAQRLQEQWQREMAGAQDKVREIHDEARRKAQQNYDEMTAKARADILTERERLHREIDMARDQALQELWNRTAQLAAVVSGKAIRKHLALEDHRRLVDEALAELGQAGNERQKKVISVVPNLLRELPSC